MPTAPRDACGQRAPVCVQAAATRRAGTAVVPLSAALGSYGIATAVTLTTTSLFLADAVHAAPLLIGVYFAGRGVFAILLNQAAGWLSDRMQDRRTMLALAGLAGTAGALGLVVLRGYVWVFLAGAVVLGISGVGYPQVFAYTRELAEAEGLRVTAFSTAIRSVFSAAWVIGPPFGFFLLTRYGFGPMYTAAAGLFLLTAALARWGLRRLPAPASPPPAAGLRAVLGTLPRTTGLLLGAVFALGVASQMYAIGVFWMCAALSALAVAVLATRAVQARRPPR